MFFHESAHLTLGADFRGQDKERVKKNTFTVSPVFKGLFKARGARYVDRPVETLKK